MHQRHLKIEEIFNEISYMSTNTNINKPIIVLQSDDKNLQNFTFKKFHIDGREELCTDTFSKIRKDNPNTAFIYYNGVNHFQALVPHPQISDPMW